MKAFLSLFALCSMQASAVTVESFFEGAIDGNRCYARHYQEQELAKHPKQTVTNFIAQKRILKTKGIDDTYILDVAVRVKSKGWLKQSLYCSTISANNPQVRCGVECDGGSVLLSHTPKGQLRLENKGFVAQGGCANEEEKTHFIEAVSGGDDVFILREVPFSQCLRLGN